ncbi:hypothetical protein [Nocardioides sp. Soil805]|uniref:hypothetical protein n=1 Tax=Nocardioides sp. Soil805 TaxID=1736416 RepID=UPI00070264BE|nr:hypothetical protein [Nocardioides sp. Soil805]KRF36100.1 hypothetical protein ASG94_01000 [Nocardioides sp. Soil805]
MIDLETPHDTTARLEAYAEVEELAEWSGWAPFAEALPWAPRLPGVYLFREHDSHHVRYVGSAGERVGTGRPQGLYGRLSVHRTGSAPVSGFGEAALDRALADPAWVQDRLDGLRAGRAGRARDWAREAFVRLAPEVSWAACPERADARHLEGQVEALLRPFGLWAR